MPYFEFEKGNYRARVPIKETRCWSCSRLRQRTDGNFCCPKNRLLRKMLPSDFAAKCTSYMKDISGHRNEYIPLPSRKSVRDRDLVHIDNERRTVSRDEQIRVLLAKGLARRYRGRVGTPQEIEKWKQEGFEPTWKSISKKERVEEFKDFRRTCEHTWEDIQIDWETAFQKCSTCGLVRRWKPTMDARAVRAYTKKLVVERPPQTWKVTENLFERPTETLHPIRDQMTSVSRISKARNIREAEYTWPLEDRDIFSISEIQVKGYCEECSNYGLLHYTDGLYLCENCRYSRMKLFW